MHLTNYSINKMHENYVQVENLEELGQSSKRTLEVMRKNLEEQEIDFDPVWQEIKELVARVSYIQSYGK